MFLDEGMILSSVENKKVNKNISRSGKKRNRKWLWLMGDDGRKMNSCAKASQAPNPSLL
jgi:hypothetical protein